MRSTAVLLIALLLAGCNGDDSADEAPLISVLPAATTTPESVEVPDSFPTDVPIPADVLLENAEAHVGQGSTIFEVTGWYDGDPIRVGRDYEKVLKDLGYEITSRTEAPNSLFYVAQNADWYVSAGFFPDPIRNVGASVGVTVAPAG